MHLFKRCILCSFEGILVISCCFCSSDAVTDVQVQLLKFRINFCCSYTVTEVQIQFLLSRCRYRVVQKKYLPPPPVLGGRGLEYSTRVCTVNTCVLCTLVFSALVCSHTLLTHVQCPAVVLLIGKQTFLCFSLADK